jgi:ribonuclease HI
MAWYAVYRGRVPGVYSSWRQCQDQVDRYTSNSYKRFNTREEAEEDYLQFLMEVP